MPVGTTIQQLKTNPVIVLELGNLIYVFLVNDKYLFSLKPGAVSICQLMSLSNSSNTQQL